MGVHPSALFALRPEALDDARQEIWQWAEMVVVDRAADYYDRAMPSRLSSNLLAKKHGRLWQAVIQRSDAALLSAWQDLRRTSDKFGLSERVTRDVNAAILEELFDIMLFRHRGSPRLTKASTMVLLAAGATLDASVPTAVAA